MYGDEHLADLDAQLRRIDRELAELAGRTPTNQYRITELQGHRSRVVERKTKWLEVITTHKHLRGTRED